MLIARISILAIVIVGIGSVARSGEPAIVYSPGEIIERSIAWHDPDGVWSRTEIQLSIHTTYSEAFSKKAGSKVADLSIVLAPGLDRFTYRKAAGSDVIEIRERQGDLSLTLNGSSDVSEADRRRLRIAEPSVYRDYCEYLYLMPMKLHDAGTILDPRVDSGRFEGRHVWKVKVTYDPAVGGDTWYFYFDHETFALAGYRFYHDESQNDGEYIIFTGEILDPESGLRLPRKRSWYYNNGDGHLATDEIVTLEVVGGPR